VKLHFGRDGFNHESSANWFEWVVQVDMGRRMRSVTLGTQNSTIDMVTTSQNVWLRDVDEIRPKKFREVRPDLLRDYSEVEVIRERLT
jgi:hypothetical protein